MEKYCDRIGIPVNSANFIYEGEKICTYNTPSELNMSNNDEIHVIIEQVGGSSLAPFLNIFLSNN